MGLTLIDGGAGVEAKEPVKRAEAQCCGGTEDGAHDDECDSCWALGLDCEERKQESDNGACAAYGAISDGLVALYDETFHRRKS